MIETMQNDVRTADPSPRPTEVHWEVQEKYPAMHFVDEVLTTGEVNLLIEQIQAFGRPYPALVFEGRNPFGRKDLLELIRYAAQKELNVNIAAQPEDFSEENLQAMKEAGAKGIWLHLEGTPETDSKNIEYQVRFFLTLKATQLARLMGLNIHIVTRATPGLLTDLPQIFRLVNRMGARTWKLLFPYAKRSDAIESELTPAEFEAVLHFAYDASAYLNVEVSETRHFNRITAERLILKNKGLNTEVLNLAPLYDVLRTSFRKIVIEEDLIPRSAVKNHLRYPVTPVEIPVYVSNTGDVYPEGFLYRKAGNITQRNLADIYQNSWLFVALRELNKEEGRCGNCEFNEICGGSTARAYMLTGDPVAVEPFCNHVPGNFGFREEIREIAERDQS